MFETLIESSGPARRRGGETVVSLALHMLVLAGAVHATERVVSGGLPRVLDTTVVFVEPSRAAAAPLPAEPSPVPRAPEALGEILPPGDTPMGIPLLDLGTRPFNAAELIGSSHPVGVPTGVSGGESVPGIADVFVSAQVDDPAVALSQPAPRYPRALKEAGVGGFVDLEYVIDSTGHAEPASVRVISTSHEPFVEAARAAILGGVCRPARYRGSAVRQLVRQRVSFQGGVGG